jgi:hypothetical protein
LERGALFAKFPKDFRIGEACLGGHGQEGIGGVEGHSGSFRIAWMGWRMQVPGCGKLAKTKACRRSGHGETARLLRGRRHQGDTPRHCAPPLLIEGISRAVPGWPRNSAGPGVVGFSVTFGWGRS